MKNLLLIIFFMLAQHSFAQNLTRLSGSIKNETGEALSNVKILFEDLTKEVYSDDDGVFYLNGEFKSGEEFDLIFTFQGYEMLHKVDIKPDPNGSFGIIILRKIIQFREDCGTPFTSTDSTFKILLFPFGNLGAEDCKTQCMASIKRRFYEIAYNEGVKIDIKVNECYNTLEEPIQHKDSAKVIGEVFNADLVLWGDYEKIENNTDVIIKYVSLNDFEEFRDFKGDFGRLQSTVTSFIKEVVDEGKLTLEIEEIMFWSLGIEFYAYGEHEQAIKMFNKIPIKPSKEYSMIYSGIAACYAELEDYETALKKIDLSLALDSTSSNIYHNRGRYFFNLKKYDDALIAYQKAIELEKEKTVTYENIGYLYAEVGEYDKALEAFDKVIELNPEGESYRNRAWVYNQLGNRISAKTDYDQAILLDSTDIK